MTTSTNWLRENLLAPHKDPERATSIESIENMLNDLRDRFCDLNSVSRHKAYKRTMEGYTDQNNLSDETLVMRSTIGREFLQTICRD